ncbi:hypothetical protein Goari_025250, partial [Gossypium aridum]|nr:hypothetical protein [Gossypium aridum]
NYEDVLHVLRDCLAARTIWDKLILQQSLSRFYTGSLLDWMTNNLQNRLTLSLDGVDWSCLFRIIAWHIWKNYNLFIFQSILIDEGFATIGGFIRDHNGRWFERVLIQTDSIEAVNSIKDGSSGNFNSTLVRRIHHILEVVKQWKIQHIPREENSIVDSLVKTLHNKRLGLRLFEDPPLRI